MDLSLMPLEHAAAELKGEAALFRSAARAEHEGMLADILQTLAYGCEARAMAVKGLLMDRFDKDVVRDVPDLPTS